MNKTEYISHPNINNGQPLSVYEMGKIHPGRPLFEMAKTMPTFLEAVQAEQKKIAQIRPTAKQER